MKKKRWKLIDYRLGIIYLYLFPTNEKNEHEKNDITWTQIYEDNFFFNFIYSLLKPDFVQLNFFFVLIRDFSPTKNEMFFPYFFLYSWIFVFITLNVN